MSLYILNLVTYIISSELVHQAQPQKHVKMLKGTFSWLDSIIFFVKNTTHCIGETHPIIV